MLLCTSTIGQSSAVDGLGTIPRAVVSSVEAAGRGLFIRTGPEYRLAVGV